MLRAGETGFFASAPGEWAEALRLLADDAVRIRLSANARVLARDYSIQKYGPIYAKFLREALR